ncbi:MAG: FKBP-type peptidyl-prolyl cis-trans isomerase [Candidatus Pacebacteria bacterium]|nr:FKBP-type peptidyl-prolyl cis-trans isomerase [Candidatus Paceibacterota bacterium]
MRKHTREEKIAITLAVLVAFVFLTIVFLAANGNSFGIQSNSNEASVYSSTYENQGVFLDLEIQDLVDGDGKEANLGDTIYVHYVGQLEDGTTFDTSTNSDTPFIVNLGTGEVITGWDLGLVGMRVGGTRRLTIPAELAYGEQEIADTSGRVIIPANSILTFDIVLLDVR